MRSITITFALIIYASLSASAQNVGIGETSPANKLSVKGALSVGAGYSTTAAPANGAIIQGNVGIGTASPGLALDVAGQTRATMNGGGASSAFIASSTGGPAYSWNVSSNGTDQKWWDMVATGTNLLGRTVNDANSSAVTWLQVNRGTGTAITSVDFPSGNVGIGNTAPTSLLSVGSSSQFQVTSAGAIAAATGITSSGTITFSGLSGTGNRPVYVSSSGVLTTGGGLGAQTLTKTSFTYTGGIQSWVVPTGVAQIFVKLWGAGGGGESTAPGGGGGFVSGVLSVTPGSTIYILVGGGGGTGRSNAYGGGGAGTGSGSGSSGGGRSAIMSSSSNSDLVTAGGGGGAAKDCYCYGGGGGGGLTGIQTSTGHTPGQGGSQTAGGTFNGSTGNGGAAATQYTGGNANTNVWGGGGGGGWYGGAAGGGTGDEGPGGGGSSYVSGLNYFYNVRNEQGSYNNNVNTSGAASATYLPGGYYDPDYTSGVGTGGSDAPANGGNGLIVIYY